MEFYGTSYRIQTCFPTVLYNSVWFSGTKHKWSLWYSFLLWCTIILGFFQNGGHTFAMPLHLYKHKLMLCTLFFFICCIIIMWRYCYLFGFTEGDHASFLLCFLHGPFKYKNKLKQTWKDLILGQVLTFYRSDFKQSFWPCFLVLLHFFFREWPHLIYKRKCKCNPFFSLCEDYGRRGHTLETDFYLCHI